MHAVLRTFTIASLLGLSAAFVAAMSKADFLLATVLTTSAAVLAALITSYASSRHSRPLKRISDKQRRLVDLWARGVVTDREKAYSSGLKSAKRDKKDWFTLYRRGRQQDTWHFCLNCSTWPARDFETTPQRPVSGELCNECEAKHKAGTCQKDSP